MRLIKVFCVLCFIAACAAQEPPDVLPVPNLQLQSKWSEVFVSEKVELKCSIPGSSDWTVLWSRDGQTIQDGPNVVLSADTSLLTITADQEGAGSYTCRGRHKTGGNETGASNAQTITVHVVKPTLTQSPDFDKMFPGESVNFTCRVDLLSDWEYVLYHDGNELPTTDGTLSIKALDKSHAGSYQCMARRGAVPVNTEKSEIKALLVSDKPQPVLKRLSPWKDVFVNETVRFECELSSSGWTVGWYLNGAELAEDDYILSMSKDGSLLNITDIVDGYGGGYSCKAIIQSRGLSSESSNTVDITVHEIPEPTVKKEPLYNPMYAGETVSFTCNVDVGVDWKYVWYKDDVLPETSQTISMKLDSSKAGNYSCMATRGEKTMTGPSEEIQQTVREIPVPSLKNVTPWRDVFPTERLELSCGMSDDSDWIYTWFRDNVEVKADSVVSFESNGATLSISSASAAHKGKYTCTGRLEGRSVSRGSDSGLDITVYGDKPTARLTQDPDYKMFLGESVSFSCLIPASSGWTYHWYKDGIKLDVSGDRHTISSTTAADRGSYHCQAERGTGSVYNTDNSPTKSLEVGEIPVPSLKNVTPWRDVFPTERLQLSCGMSDDSDWIYTWFRDDVEVKAAGVVSFDSNGATLSISSASAAHKGKYTCTGRLEGRSVSRGSDSGLDITVYDENPTVAMTQDPDYEVMFPGESVSFSCHIPVSSGWTYQWYKDDKKLAVSGNKHTISSIAPTDKGVYYCQAVRGQARHPVYNTTVTNIQVEGNKPKPVMTPHPDAKKLYTGELVSLQCEVTSGSDWQYVWHKDGAVHSSGNILNIQSASNTDDGYYECKAIRNKTKYESELSEKRDIRISEIPVPSLKNVTPWRDVFPTERLQLSCGMDTDSDWIYTWFRDNVEVKADSVVSFDSNGATLSISSASAAHKGKYTCTGRLEGRSVSRGSDSGLDITVYDGKPEVMLTRSPDHAVMFPDEKVTFSCHINVSSGWEYVWYKDNSFQQAWGHGDKHPIPSLSTKDGGLYHCQTKRGKDQIFETAESQAVKLEMEERSGASITLLTGWSDVFSTDTLVLKCEVHDTSRQWNYTWFKEEHQLNVSHSERYEVTPQNDPDQSLYSCMGIRTERPLYSKKSDQFKTKNLLLKRRVLLAISGCIVFGIAAVFIGCIVLRIFRKPAADDKRPTEDDLFVSMSLRKHCDDIPCPVVEFINEASLISPSKEGNENGTLNSETTPLPISTDVDQAEATETEIGTESNAGLLSFKS